MAKYKESINEVNFDVHFSLKKKVVLEDTKDFWVINHRYQIYKDNGVVYDLDNTSPHYKDIAQWVFKVRDVLMFEYHCEGLWKD